jgi:hypothetical protein
MKKLALAILPLILFSCTNKSNNSANKVIPESFQEITYLLDTSANEVIPIIPMIPKSYQQITYLLDTIADIYVYKTLKNISDVSLNEEGEIKSAIQTNFSFENQDGNKEESIDIYSPILHWSSLDRSDSHNYFFTEWDSILIKYFKQALTDTIVKDGGYTYKYNKNSQLISFIDDFEEFEGFQIDFLYDLHGQWTQITKHLPEYRSGHFTYEVTKREIQYNDEPIKSINPTYLTVNGENIFNKSRGIVDYYVLLQTAGIFSPENAGGTFDEPNGYFEYEDEGTGAGVYTCQLTGWRTSDGRDILGINGFFNDPGSSYPTTSGDPPTFYLFENKSFTELTNIFPEVNVNLFFDSDTGSVEGIPTYFTLPREGSSIQYILGVPLDFLRENYNDYKEICDMYSNVKRTSIEIAFDEVSGTFYVNN